MRCTCPLGGAVALALVEALPGHRRLVLRRVDVHARVRKIADSPGVVQVQVCKHDVAHVGRFETQALDLIERALDRAEARPSDGEEPAAEAVHRMEDVLHAQPCVHEYEALLGLDQQAVANEVGSRKEPAIPKQAGHAGAKRRAVEVVDPHLEYFIPRGND